MKLKLIFLLSHNFDKRNRIRLGYDQLTNSKIFDVKYWNIKDCNSKLENLQNEEYFSKYYRPFDSKIDAIKSILNLKSNNIYFIDHTSNSLFDNFLQFLFSLKGYKRIFIKAGSLPTFETNIGIFKYALMVFKDDFMKGIIKTLIYLVRKIIQPKADILIIGNDMNKIVEKELKKKSHIIYSHNFDYDNYLEIANNNISNNQNYFIFIDQNLPDHPDMFYRDKKILVERDSYWDELKLILNKIKKDLNIDFRIIPHPTTSLNILKKYFDSSQIISSNKNLYIKDCKFVICHDSTLVQLAVLWNKPIKPIIPKSIEKELTYTLNIKFFANELGLKVNLDLNNELSDQIYSSYNKKSYFEYKKKYIISSNSDPDSFFWDIFTKELLLYDEKNNLKNSN